MGVILILWLAVRECGAWRVAVKAYCVAVGVERDVAGLGSLRFTERLEAERRLEARSNWLVVQRLRWLSTERGVGVQARTAAARVAGQVIQSDIADVAALPVIDALNTGGWCSPPNTRVVDAYLLRACNCWVPDVRYGSYRAATALLLRDLRWLDVPGWVIRLMLAVMRENEKRWEFLRVSPWLGRKT